MLDGTQHSTLDKFIEHDAPAPPPELWDICVGTQHRPDRHLGKFGILSFPFGQHSVLALQGVLMGAQHRLYWQMFVELQHSWLDWLIKQLVP